MKHFKLVMAGALLVTMAMAPSGTASAANTYGVEGGMGFATLGGDAPAFVNPVAGPAAGVFARWGLSPALSIQTEAMVTTKGGAVETGVTRSGSGSILPRTGLFDSVNLDAAGLKVTSLEVPILLRIKPDVSEAMSPTLSVGPELGFELSRTRDPQDWGVSQISLARRPDVGLALGLGVEKPTGNSRWSFEARTTMGLANLETAPYQTHGIRTVSLVTMLGYGWSAGGP